VGKVAIGMSSGSRRASSVKERIEMGGSSVKDWTWVRLCASSILAATAWYLANFAMNPFNVVFFVKRAGESINFANLHYGNLWADHLGWADYFGRWLPLAIPAGVVAYHALLKIDLSWRRAAKIGLVIALAQVVAMGSARVFRFHVPLLSPDYLIYYLARFWVDLPGALAAAAAWRVNLDAELSAA